MKYLVILIVIVGAAALFAWSQDTASPAGTNEVQSSDTENETPLAETDARSDMEAGEADRAETVTDAESTAEELDIEVDGDAEVTVDAEPVDTEKTFTLDGFNYGYSEETITVNEGDTVTINLTSTDGFHDWVVDAFDAATERVQEGETTSVTFVADEAGEYEFYCSVGNHRAQGMVGTLIVQ